MLLGFDIGGTKSAVITGLPDGEDGLTITGRRMMATRGTPQQVMDELVRIAADMLQEQGQSIAGIQGIGVSCGGPLSSKKGLILSPPNLPGWDEIPVVNWLQQHYHKPVFLQNDANAGALAEQHFGAGRGCRNFVFLTFGTGMGAGLILNGALYAGTTDLAGEVGHLRLAEMGPVGFGKAGSFEGFCSGGGIAQLAQIAARQELQMGRPVSFCPSLDALPAITAKQVADAANAGDALAAGIYRQCGHYLGRGLSLIIDLLNPELILMGSIYGRAQSLLEENMRRVIAEEALPDAVADCRIAPAGLGEKIGDYAALTLAIMAARQQQ